METGRGGAQPEILVNSPREKHIFMIHTVLNMGEVPFFSVIIPTYHEEGAIGETLSSINQATNGHRIETIVVDGGSTDRTTEIVNTYTDNLHTLKKRGIGLARNFGAGKASGDLLVFLDSDTIVPENFFDELSKIFSNPTVCGANCNVMPSPGVSPTPKERFFYSLWSRTRKTVYRLRPCGTGDNGIIVRRETFDMAGGFDESMPTMEDLDFIFRASKHGRFLFLKNLTLNESMRRIRKIGIMKFSAIYIYNFFFYLVKRKPRVTRWDAVR
jgi:glycosyltransferase involved in cell wall biosynthesis